jgi:tellurite methyltransferase
VNRVDTAKRDVAAAERSVPVGAGCNAGDAVVGARGVADRAKVPIQRPAPDEGQPREIELVPSGDDFLARSAAYMLRRNPRQLQQFGNLLQLRQQRRRGLRLDELAKSIRKSLKAAGSVAVVSASKRHLHAPVGTELVDENRDIRALDVLKEQGLAPKMMETWIGPAGGLAGQIRSRRLALAIGELGDLKNGRDRGSHAHEFARFLESLDELARGRVHWRERMSKKPRKKVLTPGRNARVAHSKPRTGKPVPQKKAMDYAADFDWPGYFNAVEGKPARETLVKALALFDAEDARKPGTKRKLLERSASDIGSGEGRDTRELLRHKRQSRWSLFVTDGSSKGLDILLDSLRPDEHSRVCVARCVMESLPRIYPNQVPIGLKERPFKQVDLVNASFSLPFCPPRELPKLWKWITSRIRPGGRFAGQIFGDRDTWAHVRKTTGVSRTTLDRMFKDFVFEELREEEKDDRTTLGELKHWHVFHIVARKRK